MYVGKKEPPSRVQSPKFQGGVPDILLLQAHHLSVKRILSIGNPLEGDWHTFWSPTQGEHGRNGGVCTSIRNSSDVVVVG